MLNRFLKYLFKEEFEPHYHFFGSNTGFVFRAFLFDKYKKPGTLFILDKIRYETDERKLNEARDHLVLAGNYALKQARRELNKAVCTVECRKTLKEVVERNNER